MNEETPLSQEPEVVQTLDDVINDFNIDPSTTQTMDTAEPKPVEFAKPDYVDPLDSDQWNKYQNQQSQNQAALQGQLQDLSDKLTHYEQDKLQALVDTDIKAAVESISSKVEDSDPLMVELYLEKRARENEGFKSIWDNRAKNPKALNKALGAITNELKGKFSIKADPQLAENQRAIQQSQTSNTSNKPAYNNSIEETLGAAQSDAEWEHAWNKAVRG